MNYCCINSELYPVMLSVISLMCQVLFFFFFTKNVIFVGKTFGHSTEKCNVTGCAVSFLTQENKKKWYD